ncbi:SurA N-terminal domain-containing protein [Thalassolituus hydrocarboniclasticus]|uniref:Periplasmic chaperone PpiD n=1 Tax=Thalassolituus hydrocarboniclasticus TaxID=2742796 RepID=A0ABY6A9T1_9GAMM|nr:SurA N-terminal domain-containing protein [Thalassolituus hydrocarboniclasticus]UXD87598.1 SurA N-terminal domain-containing protein [Thalassolituus hydrocarboniclasticus]
MLQTMRDNAQGMIAKVIVFFIIFVFALWGVESIVSLGGGTPATATVGDQEITEADIVRTVEQQKANLRRQFGDQYDENLFNEKFLRQSALEQLIEQKVAVVQADKLGLRAAPRAIDEAIVTIPAFQQDGRFDKEQFQNVLRMNGLSPLTFRASLAEDIKTNQARAAFVLSSVETPFAVQVSEALNNELRTFSFYEVNARDLEASVELSDEDIQLAYEASKDRYKTEEQVRIQYVQLKRADIAAKQEVSDDELQAAYIDYQSRELAKEQRSSSHILVEVNDDRSDADALALANDIKSRLDNGEDFAALAKEYSDDIGTKNAGGNLGLSTKGSFVPEFEDVLYTLQKDQISAPVKSEFGYHIIRLDDIVTPAVKALADVKDELSREVRAGKAEAVYAEQMQELSNISFSAESIADVANALNLQLQSTDFFSRENGNGIALNDAVRQVAFAENVMLDKQISEVVELQDGAVVLAVSEHKDASVKPLAEVKSQVVASLKRERALAQARVMADAIISGDEQAKAWKKVSSTFQQSSEAPRLAQQKAFALTVGQSDVVKTPGGYTVVRLDAIDAKNWQDMVVSEEAKEAGRAQNSRADMLSYQAWAKSAINIERSGS